MNALFVSDSTTVSGAEVVMLGYLDELRARGHRAFAFIDRRNTRLAAEFGRHDVPVLATSAYSRQIIKTTPNPLALAEFARSFLAVSRAMAALVTREQIDVIHSISYPASLYAAFAAARTGVPQIWHEHNIKRLHPVNRILYRRVAATCRWVIGPSDAVTGNLARAGVPRAKLRTVYNGIDLNRFNVEASGRTPEVRRALGLGVHERAVGLFGQMLPYKGHSTLVEAAPAVLEDHPDTHFFFVGALENPPYQEELHAAIAARGLSGRFHFTGWRPDVQDLIRAMDVVVVGTTTPEPAALALMESMAMERALVATRTGGTPEIVVDGRTGLLYAPGEAGELAARIGRILANPDFGRDLGRAGRSHVEQHFSRERHVEEMFGLYERAVAPRISAAATVAG